MDNQGYQGKGIEETCWVIFSQRSSSGSSKGVSSLMQSSSGASEMLLALIEDIVDVFLELLPALIPESAESFLTN